MIEQALVVIIILLKYFFDPKQIKKREEKKIEKETEYFKNEIEKDIVSLNAVNLASDIDKLLAS